MASTYEIQIQKETAVHDDHAIPRGELAQPKDHNDRKRLETLKYLGIKPR
jgi:hypothetical protein